MPVEFHILLVEDSPSDVLIIRRALAEAGFTHRLSILGDGASAMACLDRLADPSTPADQVPDLVLLDLNLPGPDGGQLLLRIKTDTVLRTIPVVVLTTSGRDEDVWRSYHSGANTFVQKPADFQNYRELALTLRRYWEQLATRPPRRPPEE
ncbi:response regulator [Tautonia plasticadhaerens]|uniref:Response regulator rcp1 n=1 Tax=Tautonia plasticadhaerens TaxID=2527974 RepID=A0A518H9E9_9BACT|nr:response regulator [Tautonia plasticadhaerens]QDV37482.1 Response regulator rcp1 [Tautonia plasticadhaerens]